MFLLRKAWVSSAIGSTMSVQMEMNALHPFTAYAGRQRDRLLESVISVGNIEFFP